METKLDYLNFRLKHFKYLSSALMLFFMAYCINESNAGTTTIGGACNATSDCSPGNNGCWGGICTGKYLNIGNICNADNQCNSGKCSYNYSAGISPGTTGKCVLPPMPLGGICSTTSDCATPNSGCYGGICTGSSLAIGQPCNANNQCSSGNCTYSYSAGQTTVKVGSCIQTLAAIGGACSTTSNCATPNNGCWGGICTGSSLAIGKPCNANNQCTSSHCSVNFGTVGVNSGTVGTCF